MHTLQKKTKVTGMHQWMVNTIKFTDSCMVEGKFGGCKKRAWMVFTLQQKVTSWQLPVLYISSGDRTFGVRCTQDPTFTCHHRWLAQWLSLDHGYANRYMHWLPSTTLAVIYQFPPFHFELHTKTKYVNAYGQARPIKDVFHTGCGIYMWHVWIVFIFKRSPYN